MALRLCRSTRASALLRAVARGRLNLGHARKRHRRLLRMTFVAVVLHTLLIPLAQTRRFLPSITDFLVTEMGIRKFGVAQLPNASSPRLLHPAPPQASHNPSPGRLHETEALPPVQHICAYQSLCAPLQPFRSSQISISVRVLTFL